MPLSLPLTILEVGFETREPVRLPSFPGSAWRGALGWALKRSVCVIRDTRCQDCLLYRSCVFPYVFETPPPPDADRLRKYRAVPHPFVLGITPGQDGPRYRLGLTLVGAARRQLPYFIHALTAAGEDGLGRQRQPFELVEVRQAQGPARQDWATIYAPGEPLRTPPEEPLPVPPLPDWVAVELRTPLRIKREDHLVTPARFAFADLFGALLRRLSLLSYFHTERPLEADFADLMRQARDVPHHRPTLRWYDWTRYSSRQETTLEMGGLHGGFLLRGADIRPFWPYLWLGQWTHAGKGATLGLGQYRLAPASLPDPA